MVGDHPSEAPVPAHAPTMGAGRYAFAAKLALGGMAAVYRVWDHKLRVWRAVKVLLPDAKDHVRARFEAEAKMMARLDHPHVIRVYDVGTSGRLPYIVMELAEGGTVNGWVEEYGPMPPQLAVRVVMQVALGLSAAHALGLVHRDVKPHNVLVTGDGRCKVTDFGIARWALEGTEHTRTGMSMGTLGYMAPEQRNDARTVDVRADVYSLGALLYKLVVGKVLTDLFLVEHEPHLLDEVPEALHEVLVRACYRDRQRRYPDVESMRRVLAEILPLLPPDPPDTPPLARSVTAELDEGYAEIGALLDDLRKASQAGQSPGYSMSRPAPASRSAPASAPSGGLARPSQSKHNSLPPITRSLPPTSMRSLPPGPVEIGTEGARSADELDLDATHPGLQPVAEAPRPQRWVQGLAFLGAAMWGVIFAMVFLGTVEVNGRASETAEARDQLLRVVGQEQGLVSELERHGASPRVVHALGELYQVAARTDSSGARLQATIAYATAVQAEAQRALADAPPSDLSVMRVRNITRAWKAYDQARTRWATVSRWPHGRLAIALRLAPSPGQ